MRERRRRGGEEKEGKVEERAMKSEEEGLRVRKRRRVRMRGTRMMRMTKARSS